MWWTVLSWLREFWFMVSHVSGASFPEQLSPEEERDALARLAQGDKQARDELVSRNMRFVAHIARKYSNTGIDLDDLISIGSIGLIKAVDTFDAEKKTSLATYAARCIENQIRMYLRALRSRGRDVYLQESIGNDAEGNEMTLADVLGTPPDMVMDDVMKKMDTQKLYTTMRDVLTPQEIKVLCSRYGLGDSEKYPQRVIGQRFGLSRSYISRIEKRAIEKLQAAMRD